MKLGQNRGRRWRRGRVEVRLPCQWSGSLHEIAVAILCRGYQLRTDLFIFAVCRFTVGDVCERRLWRETDGRSSEANAHRKGSTAE